MNALKVNKIVFVMALALLAMACAKEDNPAVESEQRSLDAWMERHTSGFTRHESGLYTRILQAAPADAPLAEEGDWIEIRFNGYALPDLPLDPTGQMFVTRDQELAEQYGTFTQKTHYVPKKTLLGANSGFALTLAMLETLEMMRQGETREFYAPSDLTYGYNGVSSSTYGDWGYQGQNLLPGGIPSRMEIELVRVIGSDEAVLDDQNAQVEAFARERLGLDAADSLKANIYLKYTPLDPLADTIGEDSTCYIYYVGAFLDGFVFDTNIDTIAARVWGDDSKRDSLRYVPSSGGLIEAFRLAVDTMRYNSWGEMVFSSDYGYGYGQTPSIGSGGTEFDPYTPLYFKFFILPKATAEDETDE